jgi:hypothetical protein
MTGPLLIFADSYALAQIWAREHGYPAWWDSVPVGGAPWEYVYAESQVRGRKGGEFVDLTTAQAGVPVLQMTIAATKYLASAGFTELKP